MGMAPPGMQQPQGQQANRPGGMPHSFQAPPNMPNINFNAPVIRLGTGAPAMGGSRDDTQSSSRARPGLGMERGQEQGRGQPREAIQALMPPTNEEKLRTIFLHQIPEGMGGDQGIERLLGAVGRLRQGEP